MMPTASATMISGMTNSRTSSLTDGGSPTDSGAHPMRRCAAGGRRGGRLLQHVPMAWGGRSWIGGGELLCYAGAESTLHAADVAAIIRFMARPPRPGGSSEKSRRYHDRVARQYDAIYDDPYWAFHDELTWRLIKPHLPRDATAACADLGCGTGKWGMKLLKSGFATTSSTTPAR
jgi:hypothetical protein